MTSFHIVLESSDGDSVRGFHRLQESQVMVKVLQSSTQSSRDSVYGDSVTGFRDLQESKVTVKLL